jgi:phthalate 4,5-dioxygenase
MLSQEDNEVLCRVGPGTPMGNLFRQYWLPAMLSAEIADPDGDQVRVKLLGEELIAFRDTDGEVGLIGNLCPHRRASLYYARNEENGLRCIYHGWKFDKSGQCVDMPIEPPESNFKLRIKAKAYPCVERNGVVWTYMGPRETPPPLPEIEGNMVEGAICKTAMVRDCNWMQALEGDIDTGHFSWLHIGHVKPEDAEGDFLRYQASDRHPKLSVVETEWGTTYAAFIEATEEKNYVRMAHFLFPCYTMIPQGAVMANRGLRAWVPMDDTHVMWLMMSAPPLVDLALNATKPGTGLAGRAASAGGGRPDTSALGDGPLAGNRENPLVRTSDWYGRFRSPHLADHDYDLDRDEARQRKSFTGLSSVTMEDHVVTESMGELLDRSEENLGTSDAMIIQTRRRLIDAALAFRDKGVIPPGVDEPEVYHQRSGGLLIDKDANWFEATTEARRAFVNNSEAAIEASVRP